ncbi:MAG: hypothetical protein Q9224_005177, partial [Gallowayella concinna]
MEDLTTSMHNIGVGSQKEAIIMRIITAVTLIYLPGTFVSTLFSTDVVRFHDDGKEAFSKTALSRWLQVTFPLTMLTLLVAFSVFRLADKKRRTALSVFGDVELGSTIEPPSYVTSPIEISTAVALFFTVVNLQVRLADVQSLYPKSPLVLQGDVSTRGLPAFATIFAFHLDMADNRFSDHDSCMRELKAKVGACTMTAVCGRSYVLVEELTQWLRSKAHPGKSTTQLGRLVIAAYRDYNGIAPSSTDKLMEQDSYCLVIFSILLLLGRGNLIHVFQKHNILDTHLPIPLQQLQSKFETARISDAKQLAADFDEKQWPFCPAKFDFHYSQEYNEHKILPICKKEKINEKGGTAQLWQIEVKEEFVGHHLKQAVSFSRYNCSPSSTEPDWRYQFALKSFEDGSMSLYENEKTAFDALRKNNGMVQYLADYTHAERRNADSEAPPRMFGNQEEYVIRHTFNLLLEFGEFDLDEYFAQISPPSLQAEIEDFWSSLFDVADALDGIHNLKIETHGVVQEFHGWHADIKPDNILRVHGKFKLSDPGFAKFKKKAETDPQEFVLGGTETYGCVFSIAATWVVFGYTGIQNFQKVREKGIAQICSAPKPQQHAESSISSISAGDYFHDGQQILEDVTNWHRVLRSALRKTDRVTSGLLDLVDQRMLLGSADSRIKANSLCSELKQLAAQSQEGPRIEIPASIMETLLETDKDAASTIWSVIGSNVAQPLNAPDSRKARKSRLLGIPLMKTAHRSEGL